MPNPTIPAAGGAMPAEGQLNIADAFEQTRSLIIAASNLAAALDDTESQGLHAVIRAAEEKFEIAREWFEAGHEQRMSARVASRALDDINEARYLVDAAGMAAENLTKEAGNAMKSVLGVALDKLTAARDRLDVARGAPAEDHADAG
jgi:hypothetical protein